VEKHEAKRRKKERVIGRMIMSKKGFGDTKRKREKRRRVYWWEELRLARVACGYEVYMNGDMVKKLEELKKWMVEREEGVKTIIGGDFIARTGREGG